MTLRELPIVSTVYNSGADDRVFDGLLLAGPVVVVLIAALGRSLLTELLALAYIAVFLGYVLYCGVGHLGRD